MSLVPLNIPFVATKVILQNPLIIIRIAVSCIKITPSPSKQKISSRIVISNPYVIKLGS